MSASVPLQRVLRLCDPRSSWPWNCQAPDAREQDRLLRCAEMLGTPVAGDGTAVEHIGRVLYLAQHGWNDAIEMDIGIPCLGYAGPSWPVLDGNHRLWAAALRGDHFIFVDVAGQVDHAARLLGVPECEITGDRKQAAQA